MFRRFDSDGDGRLSPAELHSPRIFKRLDRDGDGFVTLEEARASGVFRDAHPTMENVPYGPHERNVLDFWYRFRKHAPIQEILRDAARAIQFIRHKAGEWNVDKKRIAKTGANTSTTGTTPWR